MSHRPPRPSLRSVCVAPLRARTYRHLVYLALVFPLGTLYFNLIVVGLSLALPLAILVVGVPLFVATLLLVRGLAAVERRLTRYLLGTDLPRPGYPFLDGSPTERVKALVFDGATWRECCYLLLKFPAGVAAVAFLSTFLTVSLTLLATPVVYDTPGVRVGFFPRGSVTVTQSLSVPWGDLLVGVDVATTVSEWAVDSLADALLVSLLGVGCLFVTLNLVNAAAWLSARTAAVFLGEGTHSDSPESS